MVDLVSAFLGGLLTYWWAVLVVLLVFGVLGPSLQVIGPTQVGLLTKKFGSKKLSSDNPVAFNGEAGYQADYLMPGIHFVLSIWYRCKKFDWVQVPTGQVGYVISQVGLPLEQGQKSGIYKKEFGDFRDLRVFVDHGGQKGIQRQILPPGAIVPMHPIGFLVLTKERIFGESIETGKEKLEDWGFKPGDFDIVRIEPQIGEDGKPIDVVGIVTTQEGPAPDKGDIAVRLGGFDDIAALEKNPETNDGQIIERLFESQNNRHASYQDYQAFLDTGGRMGLQHDPLTYGTYLLNRYLVKVEVVPMLVVQQGQVAVIKAYVGLETEDTSGPEFKFGSLVRPGHRGIWQEALRTGKYPFNPRIYSAEMVPTAILTLSWADYSSKAHDLDKQLKAIDAKSREGFSFSIDLQVQIHVPDTKASRVISMVGTMRNLVEEVLQSAVGNHFRDKLQSMPAVDFIENRKRVQDEATSHITQQLSSYFVEVRGVYIQDVVLPKELVEVLTERELANQNRTTFDMRRQAEEQRLTMEEAGGRADRQRALAASKIEIDIKTNEAQARTAEAQGEAAYISQTGTARAAEVRATGMAKAEAYERQVSALGPQATALVNALTALAEHNIKVMPEILVAGGGDALSGLAATLMQTLKSQSGQKEQTLTSTHSEEDPGNNGKSTTQA